MQRSLTLQWLCVLLKVATAQTRTTPNAQTSVLPACSLTNATSRSGRRTTLFRYWCINKCTQNGLQFSWRTYERVPSNHAPGLPLALVAFGPDRGPAASRCSFASASRHLRSPEDTSVLDGAHSLSTFYHRTLLVGLNRQDHVAASSSDTRSRDKHASFWPPNLDA